MNQNLYYKLIELNRKRWRWKQYLAINQMPRELNWKYHFSLQLNILREQFNKNTGGKKWFFNKSYIVTETKVGS